MQQLSNNITTMGHGQTYKQIFSFERLLSEEYKKALQNFVYMFVNNKTLYQRSAHI